MRDIRASVDLVKAPWIGSPYYADAEKWTFVFWKDGTPFRQWFDRLDVTACAELACGHGRHAEQLLGLHADTIASLHCLDVLEENVAFTRQRLRAFPQVTVLPTSGIDFRPIGDGALTAIFCYDAMVHFSSDIVESYLADAARVLASGGRALLHHSNLDAPETGAERHYGQNPHARNHMTLDLFRGFADGAGLRIVDTRPLTRGQEVDLDRLTLLERPA